MNITPSTTTTTITNNSSNNNKRGKKSSDRKTVDIEGARIPIVMAVIRLLQKISVHLLHSHLPKLIIGVVNLLSLREQPVRDLARQTLVDVMV